MPNWNYNSVEIHAPLDAVKSWLVPTKDNVFAFNMHLLFPERFDASDPIWDTGWEYDRFVENTGAKWAPEVTICASEVADFTVLGYDTARTPNNGTLQRLHDKTGRTIRNEYLEEGMQVAGCFTCENGQCCDEEQEYMTSCEICEERKPDEHFDEKADDLICNDCRRKAKIAT